MTRTDVAVVGLGAHGSAALFALAQKNISAIGIDMFRPPHPFGSSHGETRITRLATGEGEIYSLLAARSISKWKRLEKTLELKYKLYERTGGLIIGSRDGHGDFHGKKDFFGETLWVAQAHRIPHALYSAPMMRREYPQLRVESDEIGYFEPDAGILFPEKCVQANLTAAEKLGARIYLGTRVEFIRQVGDEVLISTSDGEVRARRCILAPGPFINDFLPISYRKYFSIHRQPLFWFLPKKVDMYRSERFPIFIWQRWGIYGFPDLGDGVKVAPGGLGNECEPHIDKIVEDSEWDRIESILRYRTHGLLGNRCKATTCFYTQTPDGDFVIDWHPKMSNVLIVSACSGHGFKHSAAVGDLAAHHVIRPLVDDPWLKLRLSTNDIQPFSISRFAANPTPKSP